MDYNKIKDDCVNWIRDWFDSVGGNCNAVIGMSGGKDSTVTAALCVEALGKDRVIGVSLPSGSQSLNEADTICKYLDIKHISINIGNIEAACREQAAAMPGGEFSTQTIQNIPPRLRMTMLYAVAQTMNGLVANTCNLSEDYIGYATIYGDASGAFSPLGKLCVREVLGVGHALGLPSQWVEKTPDDGLPNSSPDEVKLGFTYATLDHYIREGICEDAATKEKIDRLYIRNKFKTDALNLPTFEPDLLD